MHTKDYQRRVTCAIFLLTSQVFKKCQHSEEDAILSSTFWVQSDGSRSASYHHRVLTTSTRELAAFVMMPSRLEADRKIKVASTFYPSRATYSGQASCKRRITRLNA
ncbi:uncharacterized protein [Dermacentor andersoni]|uniref:uncharacterized protein n=1 Tax=Dermacentor andersoni TaxID=34620 RepID=UPI003B3B495A